MINLIGSDNMSSEADNQQPSLINNDKEGSTTKVSNSDVRDEHEVVFCMLCIEEKGCSDSFTVLDPHLKWKHKMTRNEYLARFPGSNVVANKFRLRYQGQVAWNKGMTKETNDAVAVNALSTQATRLKLSAEGKLPIWNRGLSVKDSLVWRTVVEKAHKAARLIPPWNKGLTKDNNDMLSKVSVKVRETIVRKLASGELIPQENYYATYKAGFREDLGHYVRSSWEANIARILKFLDLEYKYEPKLFSIRDGSVSKFYRPDFYIPIIDVYVEVKGYVYIGSMEKIILFKEQYPEKQLFLVLRDEYYFLKKSFSSFINWES